MFQATVNGKAIKITVHDGIFQINGKDIMLDIFRISDHRCHVLYNNKGYNIETIARDAASKRIDLTINNRHYQVTVKDKFDLLLEQMGLKNEKATSMHVLRAPMPGLVVDLKVKVGNRVQEGDPLVILEAMKMENIIRAAGEGIVKAILTEKGEGVEKNQVLIEFDHAV